MSTSRQVSFFNRISTRVLFALLFSFLLVIAVVFW